MTGFSILPTAPEQGPGQHHQKLTGISRILGPQWAHFPTITVGLLGVQIFWSVEMSYGGHYPYMLIKRSAHFRVSFALLAFSGFIQVKNGCRLRCGAPFWTYHATADR